MLKKKKTVEMIDQREYRIIDPNTSDTPYHGTTSIRGCFFIGIYHPNLSCIIHWDDNCKFTALENITDEYLKQNVCSMEECTVSVIGGWPDHEDSLRNGEYIVDFFSNLDANIDLEHGYLEKSESGDSRSTQGFHDIYLNITNGSIFTSDNWTAKRNYIADFGDDHTFRLDIFNYLSSTHLQVSDYPTSGSSLINRDTFMQQYNNGALNLCMAARDGNIDALIQQIDQGITPIDVSPQQAKGWTALHYACRLNHLKVAEILIDNGANLFQQNDAKRTPYHLLKDDNSKTKLLAFWKVAQANLRNSVHSFTTLSLYSRSKEYITEEFSQEISSCKSKIEDLKTRGMFLRI